MIVYMVTRSDYGPTVIHETWYGAVEHAESVDPYDPGKAAAGAWQTDGHLSDGPRRWTSPARGATGPVWAIVAVEVRHP